MDRAGATVMHDVTNVGGVARVVMMDNLCVTRVVVIAASVVAVPVPVAAVAIVATVAIVVAVAGVAAMVVVAASTIAVSFATVAIVVAIAIVSTVAIVAVAVVPVATVSIVVAVAVVAASIVEATISTVHRRSRAHNSLSGAIMVVAVGFDNLSCVAMVVVGAVDDDGRVVMANDMGSRFVDHDNFLLLLLLGLLLFLRR